MYSVVKKIGWTGLLSQNTQNVFLATQEEARKKCASHTSAMFPHHNPILWNFVTERSEAKSHILAERGGHMKSIYITA